MRTAVGGQWPPPRQPLAPNGKIDGSQPHDQVAPTPSNTQINTSGHDEPPFEHDPPRASHLPEVLVTAAQTGSLQLPPQTEREALARATPAGAFRTQGQSHHGLPGLASIKL